MGIGFLAPLFILGLLALVIPILIHLIQRDRKEIVRFPSLMFLEKVPYRSVRRQTIRHWLLFLIRSAAVALLALAFARPLLDREGAAGAADRGPREVVVLLDASYSMSADDRFERAKGAAEEVFMGMRPNDRASLIVFDEDARGLRRSEADPEPLMRALEPLTPGSEGTRFGPALKIAQTILETSEQPVREIVLISDFQERAWQGDEDLELPPETEVIPLRIGDGMVANVAIAGVTFQRDAREERERVSASVRLTNFGGTAVTGLEVHLNLSDRRIQTVSVDLDAAGEPSSTRAVDFEPFTVSERDTRGRISIDRDRLPADDDFHFVLSPESGISVLVIEPSRRRADASLFLTRALEIGDAPGFRARVRREDRLTAADFAESSVVVFNGAGLPESLAPALRTHLEGGGGVLVALDESSSWPQSAINLLPGTFSSPVNRTRGGGGALGWVDLDHPSFEAFGLGGDLAGARFYRYRTVQPDSAADVIARFDDGAAALLEHRVGEGRLMLWSSGLDNFWNDLALQPVYLPFVQRSLAHLAGVAGADPWHPVGAAVDLAALWEGEVGRAMAEGESWLLEGPETEPAELVLDGAGSVFTRLERSGVYQVRPARTGSSGRWFAANSDRAESNLAATDEAEVAAAIGQSVGSQGEVRGPDPRTRAEDRERRQSLWWYILAAVFGLLMLDTAVGNRLSRQPA